MPEFDNLGTMSDEELLALAQSLGIDPAPFQAQPLGGLLNFAEAPFGAGGGLSPEVKNLVSQVFQSQRELGQEELTRGATESAGRRGLGLQDTPIAEPLTRAQALLESQLRGQEASSLLGLSQFGEQALQQRQGLFNQQNQFDQNLQLAFSQFQDQLRQQAFQNRLALAGQVGQLGLGLGGLRTGTGVSTTSVNPGLSGTLGNLGLGAQILGIGLGGTNLFGR